MQNEKDPTRQLRETLVGELKKIIHTENDDDERIFDKFRKGFFFVPSETTKRISELINAVSDEEKQKELYRLYSDILSQGL